ncbi:vitamin B12-dependent ribonucleotide reductase [Kiritimatiellaeota bacterium B1221]|nr:vitamin B12-dependent ribonucleotide reductase [Kiritimatiellaeota bacterium B1221]
MTQTANPASKTPSKLHFKRSFSTKGVSPFDQVKWQKRTASISDDKGGVLFEQSDVEVPETWSMLATNVVASKYFYGKVGTPEREFSVRQLIHRVSRSIADWGLKDGYFENKEDADLFYDELTWLCLNQYGAFNSPVWFNCGLYHEYNVGEGSGEGSYYWDPKDEKIKRANTQYEYPQCSACFIQSVEDTMDSIMALAQSEAMLFKFGSGTGSDLTPIRSSRETMSGGGTPSGPLSFLRVYDSVASVVKSGGKTRRAAKMNSLKVHHPDIMDFIQAKTKEEQKAWALIEEGYSGDFNGDAYGSVCFQNENLSVRVTDAFMQAVIDDKEWTTTWVTDPTKSGPSYPARDLLNAMAEGTWICGDPGVQYEDTIQRWHTCPESGPINASNPCSEYMFLDDTACNLASLNLMKFMDSKGNFDVARFKSAVDIFITAQDILVDNASYPTAQIAANSHRYRTLGLGFANLGALLMGKGHSYDSDEGRSMAGAITAVMHLEAFCQSARISNALGSFDGYAENKSQMLSVVQQHADAIAGIGDGCPAHLLEAAEDLGTQVLQLGKAHGFRNAQVTVLAPTGTIGFLMDCDTTGIEPDIALVKYKMLAGGGMLKIVNQTVPMALKQLGYSSDETTDIVSYIDANDTIEGAPHLKDEDLKVFDCAFVARNGTRSLSYQSHLRMMAAAQPFLSGAISKTVNMPKTATVEEIAQTYIEGWKLGLKAVAIYRDGSKRSQPVNSGAAKEKKSEPEAAGPRRMRLDDTRQSITHKFEVAGHEGYLTVGLYADGTPGELFIIMAKEGSTVGGLMDAFGTAVSMCLQYGVPVEALNRKFMHARFEPSGFSKNPDIPMAKSLIDYIFRWMHITFVENKPVLASPATPEPEVVDPVSIDNTQSSERVDSQFEHFMDDAPACDICGSITVRNGACYKCFNCGNSMGCS